jgi:hypothetical protein
VTVNSLILVMEKLYQMFHDMKQKISDLVCYDSFFRENWESTFMFSGSIMTISFFPKRDEKILR